MGSDSSFFPLAHGVRYQEVTYWSPGMKTMCSDLRDCAISKSYN